MRFRLITVKISNKIYVPDKEIADYFYFGVIFLLDDGMVKEMISMETEDYPKCNNKIISS
jgi:hypothetical protein